jgi:large subunit ribosomal protein L25
MSEVTLAAEVGRPIGSSASGRLRASGKIPGVVYGHGNDPVPVAIEARALRTALSGDAGTNVLINLDLGGRSELAITKDIQRDPVRHVVTHVDFLIVRRDEIITADVPIALVGEASEVLRPGGVVAQELMSLTVQARPGRIPAHIEVDVSALTIGDAIRLGDITLPDGVTTDADPDQTLVVGQPPQVSAEDLLTEEQQEEIAAAAAEAGEAASAVAEEAVEAGGPESSPEAE